MNLDSIDEVRKLMQAMGKSGLKRLKIKQGETEIELEREDVERVMLEPFAPQVTHRHHAHDIPPSLAPPLEKKEAAANQYAAVTAPMVGTFYSSPAPDKPAFVKVGDTIESDSVICIVEAMKVMNEVKAGVEGVVRQTLLSSGDPVEFGTELFFIEPKV